MELILWRHAEAEDGLDDAKRELTRRGKKQAERMARWLKAHMEGEWKILVSPAKRALQTVKPLELPFEENPAVGTSASAPAVLRAAGWPTGKDNVVVVGHQPTFGEVAATILETAAGELSVRKGAIWWFATRSRDAGAEVALKAVLSPEMLD